MKIENRDIKFRAWDGKRLIFKELFDRNWYNASDANSKLVREAGTSDHRKYPVMQYTGLKDKKGKEIYEGDILKHNLWDADVVIWEAPCFRGKNDERDVFLAHHQLNRTRIIGNIYENPELLDNLKGKE